jgi:hypothetical protein
MIHADELPDLQSIRFERTCALEEQWKPSARLIESLLFRGITPSEATK